ncbi:X-box-binding protein [Salix suchowensis]|nr:X-box-binding protein [Salix suchowensis]
MVAARYFQTNVESAACRTRSYGDKRGTVSHGAGFLQEQELLYQPVHSDLVQQLECCLAMGSSTERPLQAPGCGFDRCNAAMIVLERWLAETTVLGTLQVGVIRNRVFVPVFPVVMRLVYECHVNRNLFFTDVHVVCPAPAVNPPSPLIHPSPSLLLFHVPPTYPNLTMPASSSFVDPSSLSLPSPSHSPSQHQNHRYPPRPQPASNRPQHRPRHPPSLQGSGLAPKHRRGTQGGRAHRNRIAAQNSRDRRKAQFQLLERRVAELEEENRVLRASISLASISVGHNIAATPVARPKLTPAEEQREKENQELKERIRTLEKGWDAVVKALAAQGLPTGISLSGPEASTSTPTAQTASLPPTA